MKTIQPQVNALRRARECGKATRHRAQLRPQREEDRRAADVEENDAAIVAAGNGGDAGKELGPAVGKRVEEVVALGHQVLKRGVDRRAEGPVPSALVQADCLAV